MKTFVREFYLESFAVRDYFVPFNSVHHWGHSHWIGCKIRIWKNNISTYSRNRSSEWYWINASICLNVRHSWLEMFSSAVQRNFGHCAKFCSSVQCHQQAHAVPCRGRFCLCWTSLFVTKVVTSYWWTFFLRFGDACQTNQSAFQFLEILSKLLIEELARGALYLHQCIEEDLSVRMGHDSKLGFQQKDSTAQWARALSEVEYAGMTNWI